VFILLANKISEDLLNEEALKNLCLQAASGAHWLERRRDEPLF